MLRQNTFSYLTISQFEHYQIQETGRVLFIYNIINTSKRPGKVFQIMHSTKKIGMNFPFSPIFLFGRKQLASLASGEGSYMHPVRKEFVPLPFNNENM